MNGNSKIMGKEKIIYGMGDLSANILLAEFSFYLLFFMVSIGGLKPALASLVFFGRKNLGCDNRRVDGANKRQHIIQIWKETSLYDIRSCSLRNDVYHIMALPLLR